MDWTTAATTILVAAIPAAFIYAGVVITQKGKREEIRAERENSLEQRMDALERKLDQVQANFRAEQRFSHRMILVMYSVISYIRAADDYRERHRDVLPVPIPALPDVEEIEKLLAERPTYNARDEP